MTEIRFVPDDASVLDDMYKAVQECSLLHPDASSDLSSTSDYGLFKNLKIFSYHVSHTCIMIFKIKIWFSNVFVDEEEDPAEMFADFPEEGNGDEEGQEEVEGEDDEEAQRLEEFMRMQLHFRNRNGNNEEDEEDANGDGHPGDLSFTPEPGQFDDV